MVQTRSSYLELLSTETLTKVDRIHFMDFVLVIITAFAASVLTFFSGFGLGTILLPVFSLFFPVESAILLTAIVHLLNNVLKFGLMWGRVDWNVILRFGVPAILGALLGVEVLQRLGDLNEWNIMGRSVDPLGLIIGLLIILFALQELFSLKSKWSFSRKWLVPGGILSGFFGGLSGHQGALRSMFLLHSGLSKEAYIASGIAIALLVDLTRIPLYLRQGSWNVVESNATLLTAAVLSAMLGAILGRQLLKKVTYDTIQWIVGILLMVLGVRMIF
jgi:uncharacterized membrane protein YfcA